MSNNTEKNYPERRKSLRTEMKERIIVTVFGKKIERKARILNMSRHGALIKTNSFLDRGEAIDILMPNPAKPDNVDIKKAKVVHTISTCSMWGTCNHHIGVAFANSLQPHLVFSP